MSGLTGLDIIVLLAIFGGAAFGLIRGFITEVISLFAWVAPRPYRVNGPAAALAIGGVLFALSGTRIEVKNRDADIFILII